MSQRGLGSHRPHGTGAGLISSTESETYAHVGLRDGEPVFRAPFCIYTVTVEDSAFVPCSCIHILSGRISRYSLASEMLIRGGRGGGE